MITKTINLKFLTLARNWSLYSWSFLTLGITLGSWWAYYELGWGGWWFWDPVENASLMPWISGLATNDSCFAYRPVLEQWRLATCFFLDQALCFELPFENIVATKGTLP